MENRVLLIKITLYLYFSGTPSPQTPNQIMKHRKLYCWTITFPKTKSQVQPLDQAPHAQDHEADRQYQRDAAVWGTGRRGIFS